jgi:DNA-directed RNA polymerase subunit RPC12/RpoP
MKTCPGCQAEVNDNAKFCIKCGFNIKKHEEEKANQEYFCPECGTKFSGEVFCPECGYRKP